MANVAGSVIRSSEDSNLTKFSALAASFGRAAFSPEYEPWTYTDTFGRSKIYKSLLATHPKADSAPKRVSVQGDLEGNSTVCDQSAVRSLAAKSKRGVGAVRGRPHLLLLGVPVKTPPLSPDFVHMYLCTYKL